MDRFVPEAHDAGEMTRHLRAVPDAPTGAAFVVGRSAHVRPGTPYVIAQCVDRSVAAVFALAGQQVHSRQEMERDTALRRALTAWEQGDRSVFETERKARAAVDRTRGQAELREVRWHPSRAQRAHP